MEQNYCCGAEWWFPPNHFTPLARYFIKVPVDQRKSSLNSTVTEWKGCTCTCNKRIGQQRRLVSNLLVLVLWLHRKFLWKQSVAGKNFVQTVNNNKRSQLSCYYAILERSPNPWLALVSWPPRKPCYMCTCTWNLRSTCVHVHHDWRKQMSNWKKNE